MKIATRPELGQCVGGYRLVRPIANGDLTGVYEAVHATIGGRSAVKVLLNESPDVIERFLSEARAANVVRHPNVVRIYDFGQAEGSLPYLAMEYLDGELLSDRLQQKGQLAIAESLHIGRQIAAGLAAAHEVQVVHRNLKPSNVMIVPDDETAAGERAIIFDFSQARLSEVRGGFGKTNTNMVMGTPNYMSPEQCKSAKGVTGQADVYTLGVTLFEMIAGRLPFEGKSPADVVTMHLRDTPPRLSELRSDCPPTLSALVERMLGKSPDSRPTMAEAATLLREMGETGVETSTVKENLRQYLPTKKSLRAAAPTTAAVIFDSARVTLRTEQQEPKPAPAAGTQMMVETPRWRGYSLRRHWPWIVAGIVLGIALILLVLSLAH